MHSLSVTTWINAPPLRCFDLARCIEAHLESAKATGERVIAGPSSGLLEMGDEITFEAKHFGITQRLASRITAFNPPAFFQDRMVRGPFRFLEHDHFFNPAAGGGTDMIDVLRFAAPLGPLGWIAERILLARHLRLFLVQRGHTFKSLAEKAANIAG